MRWLNQLLEKHDRLFVALIYLLIGVMILFCLFGCGSTTETRSEIQRQTRTISKTIQQQITSTGEIVELTTVSTSTTDEQTGETRDSVTEVQPPRVVGSVGRLMGVVAGAAAGPGVGAAVEHGVDWLTALLSGGGMAAVTAGAGHVVLGSRAKRKIEEAQDEAESLARQRRELVRGVERAKGRLTPGAWETLTAELEKEQSQDTKNAVADITALHRLA